MSWITRAWERRAQKVNTFSPGRFPATWTVLRREDANAGPVCCIYHPQREVGESSDDSSSDESSSDSDSDSDVDNGEARPSGGKKAGGGRRGRRPHEHNHGHEQGEHGEHGEHRRNGGSSGEQNRRRRKPSPNAYEKMPKVKK